MDNVGYEQPVAKKKKMKRLKTKSEKHITKGKI